MTVVEDMADRDEPTIIEEPTGTEPRPVAPPSRRRTILARGLVAVLAVLVAYGFFGAFVTHLWFQTRQRSLGAEGLNLVAARTGQSVGVLQMQTPVVLNLQIVQGDGPNQLREGPGHRPGTPLPGLLGNSVIYGHDKEWGGPFRDLDKVLPGTQLFVRTRAQTVLAYTVTGAHVVPSAGVAAYVGRSTDYRLTLVTDATGRFPDERLVVTAVSGTKGTLRPAPAGTTAGPPGAGLLNRTLLSLVGWLVATVAVVLLLRRRHRIAVVIVAAAPLGLAALLAAFLELGLLWSPLA